MSDHPVMLAGKAPADLSTLRYPMLASVKLDGIRAYVERGVVYSRNRKPIPNRNVQRKWGLRRFDGLDGELIVGSAFASNVFRRTDSVVMSNTQIADDVQFYVFDRRDAPHACGYAERHLSLRSHYTENDFVLLPQFSVGSKEELAALEVTTLAQGYEGLMLRDPLALYKFGRSTTREAALLKLKRFEHGEARIVCVEPWRTNTNARDAAGKRTTHKAGKVACAKLGALVVEDVKTGVQFNIGTGFDDLERKRLWKQRDELTGLIVRYKFFPTGSKVAPRFPVFDGFRNIADM